MAYGTTEPICPELRKRAVRMVYEHAAEYPSQLAAIQTIATKLGCTGEMLRKWVRQEERDRGSSVLSQRFVK